MCLLGFLLLLLLLLITGGTSSSPQKVCNYQDILDHLNLTSSNERFTLTRPVLDHTHRTDVHLDVILYAILSVSEKSQTFIPLIWIAMSWNNDYIKWDPSDFCGINRLILPKEMLWRPDLFIFETTEKESPCQTPYLYVMQDGRVYLEEAVKVTCTCKLDVYKFPFDTQSCNLTFASAVHHNHEMLLTPMSDSLGITEQTRSVMQAQGEWEFLHLLVNHDNFTIVNSSIPGLWSRVTYTITMKRIPILCVINFLIPILFFLALDLSSFLIAEQRGEKLGFKVTVLLAISVLLLILNDMLPSMSGSPLIATYCIVIFGLMLLSLLETVVVTYLMELDNVPVVRSTTGTDTDCNLPMDCQDKQEDIKVHGCDGDERRQNQRCDVIGGDTPSDLMTMAAELRELQRSVSLVLQQSRQEAPWRSGGYWTDVASKINKAFLVFYCTTVSVFLIVMYAEWST